MRFLVFDDLCQKGIKYSRPHIKRLVAKGIFPPPVRGVCRENAWTESVIDEYVAGRVAATQAVSVEKQQKIDA